MPNRRKVNHLDPDGHADGQVPVIDGGRFVIGDAGLTGREREVLMATGVTPPEPLESSDGYDWLYGRA